MRIGNICVLIIYIPIFRFGNCKKFPQMEYYIVYSCRKVVIDRSSQNGFVFSSKHFDEGPDTDFRWRIGAEFKEGHLDGEEMLTIVTIGDGPKKFPTSWENGLLVAIKDLRLPEEEATPALEKIREEIEQMRESDSDEAEGPN